MRMDDAVIHLHKFLGTFNTMEIKGHNTQHSGHTGQTFPK